VLSKFRVFVLKQVFSQKAKKSQPTRPTINHSTCQRYLMHRYKQHLHSKRRIRKKAHLTQLKPGADARLKKVFAVIGVPPSRVFRPDPFQIDALAAVQRSDCLVTAPTGAGKTWIAERAIARIHEAGGNCWYACPLKALSNAKYAEFSDIFGAENVGILTGDHRENPDAPIIVGTTEILRNQLYDAMHHGVSLATDFVILDEAHFPIFLATRNGVWCGRRS